MAISIFISYSHKDEKLRKELEDHLSNLKNQGVIDAWYDGNIIPGTEWEPQILKNLNTAQIILLLVSSNFMASSFCNSVELKRAIERHDANQARVLPIILKSVDWEGSPFSKLQVLPAYGKPVSKWPSHDDAFKDIIQGIKKAIQDLSKGSAPNHP